MTCSGNSRCGDFIWRWSSMNTGNQQGWLPWRTFWRSFSEKSTMNSTGTGTRKDDAAGARGSLPLETKKEGRFTNRPRRESSKEGENDFIFKHRFHHWLIYSPGRFSIRVRDRHGGRRP